MSATEQRGRLALGRTPDGEVLPSAARRARRTSLEDPVLGWAASIGLTLFAAFLRLWQLGQPRAFSFDETYYAKDAWSLLHHGYVQSYVDEADEHILAGQTMDQWTGDPSMAVHPEVGKWMIALGEWAFGMDPLGWRVSAAVTGSLMVLVMIRLARRLTGSTLLGLVAGLLMTLDGLQLVLSRLALLDIFVAFWLLLAVHLLVMDRDHVRRRLAAGAGLRWRPWLLLSGVAWGLAIGTKWTPVYALAVFGLLAWAWTAGARRAAGVRRRPVLRSLLTDAPLMALMLVGTALVTYVLTWTGWLLHAHEYEEHLSATQYRTFDSWDGTCKGEDMQHVKSTPDRRWPTAGEKDASGVGEVVQSLRSLWAYHHDVYVFHTHYLNCAEHTYASKPSGWLLLNRPVGVDAQNDIKPGQQGCDAAAGSTCLRQVLLLGNPVLWWGSLVALVASLYFWVLGRDWRFGIAVLGTLSTWLPWLMYDDRPIFSFYAICSLPFLVLACTLVIGKLLGRSTAPTTRRTVGVIVAGSFVVLVALAFAWFWPIWTDELITRQEWLDRIWFQRWV